VSYSLVQRHRRQHSALDDLPRPLPPSFVGRGNSISKKGELKNVSPPLPFHNLRFLCPHLHGARRKRKSPGQAYPLVRDISPSLRKKIYLLLFSVVEEPDCFDKQWTGDFTLHGCVLEFQQLTFWETNPRKEPRWGFPRQQNYCRCASCYLQGYVKWHTRWVLLLIFFAEKKLTFVPFSDVDRRPHALGLPSHCLCLQEYAWDDQFLWTSHGALLLLF